MPDDPTIPPGEIPPPYEGCLPSPPSMESLLNAVIMELKAIRAESASIRKDQALLREQVEQRAVAGPGVNVTIDPNTPNVEDSQFARRVTLTTRPVQENPQDYQRKVKTDSLRLPG